MPERGRRAGLIAPVAAFILGVVPAVHADSEMSDSFARLLEREWDYQMERNPVWASLLGDRRFNRRWDDLSLAALEADHRHNQAVLRDLGQIDREQLSADARLDYDLLKRDYALWVEGFAYRWYLLPVSPMTGLPEGLKQAPGVQFAYRLGDTLRFETRADYADWIARLAAFPAYVEQSTALMRAGIDAGIVHPKVVVQRVLDAVTSQVVDAPDQSGFYAPFREFPAQVPPADQKRLAAEARDAIATGVLPALAAFERFLTREYLPAAPERTGVWQMPQGERMYAYFARVHTTTDLTPAEIHAIGQREVARIEIAMGEVRQETGFAGDAAAFREFMRSDPQFFGADADRLLLEYRALAKTIDPKLMSIIGTLPRMQYGVVPTPASVAPSQPSGFYYPGATDGSRPGEFQVNTFEPETRPSWQRIPLTLHEAVPGHHLQTAIAAELEGLSGFRRTAYHMAFGEGWALYCEGLGYELGLYANPYDRYGQLSMEMWRAIRLVVDTGIHEQRWTRAQAIDYFLAHSAMTRHDIEVEVDRYIAWPGQALAYKIGQLEILDMRQRAERALGERFDVRGFHDRILEAGSLPLDVLAARVDQWIAARGR
jgi:uncharacterized protein (DUF885 family)